MDAETKQPDILKKTIRRSIIVSILMIVAGLLAIAAPAAAGIAINIMVGWLLIFTGAAHFFYVWEARGWGGVISGVLLGILYLAIGTYLLVHPLVGLVSLTLALAMYLFAEGILEFILSFQLSSGWMVLHGIITFILGVLIWRAWPWSTEWAIGTLVGISILFSGIARFGFSLAARHNLTATPKMA